MLITPWVPALCQARHWAPLRVVDWNGALTAPTHLLAPLNLEGGKRGKDTLLAGVWWFLQPLGHSFIPPWVFPAPLSARARMHKKSICPIGRDRVPDTRSTSEMVQDHSGGGLLGVRGPDGQTGTPLGLGCPCLWNHTQDMALRASPHPLPHHLCFIPSGAQPSLGAFLLRTWEDVLGSRHVTHPEDPVGRA